MKPEPDPDKARREYLKWAGAGMQMVITIGGFAWLGWYLDKRQGLQTPWWTLGLSLFGCILSLYSLIRSFLK